MIPDSKLIEMDGANLLVSYDYTPEIPGCYDRAPEDCYPTEPAILSLNSVLFEGVDILEWLTDNTQFKISSKILQSIDKG
jgi:hypothetical protein